MKLSLSEKFGLAGVVAFLAGIAAVVAGYFTNIFWLFNNSETLNGEFFLAAVGVIVGPLGALHGIWTWF